MLVAAMNPTPDGKCPENRAAVRARSRIISVACLVRYSIESISTLKCRPLNFRNHQRTHRRNVLTDPRRVRGRAPTPEERFKEKPKITCNARMGSRELKNYCALTEQIMELLKFAMSDLNLSARAYDRILKVARTIGRFSRL